MILKIVLTLPHGIDKSHTAAWRCIELLPPVIAGYEIRPIASYGANIANVRNFGVNENGCNETWQNNFNFDAVLFWDYDIEATAEQIELLLLAGQDIIGGMYLRGNGYQYECGNHGTIKGLAREKLQPGDKGRGPVPIDYIGAGFLLIKQDIFRRLPYPWFRYERIEWEENGVWHSVPGNEDIGFCMLAYKNGFPIYAHTNCIVKHIKGGPQMNMPQQQISEVGLENNIGRACTQIQASTQMLIDQLRQLSAQNNQLREEIKKLKEKLAPCQTDVPVEAEAKAE
jgi:hypothetical protein